MYNLPENIVEYGIPVIVITIVFKFIVDILSHTKKQNPIPTKELLILEKLTKINDQLERLTPIIQKIHESSDELHKMHDIQDEDGVPRWYVKEELMTRVHDTLELCLNIQRDVKQLLENDKK